METAFCQADAWLALADAALVAEDGGTTWKGAKAILLGSNATGPKVHDAKLVAICAARRIDRIWSADRDLSRFRQVSVVKPLA